MRKVVLSLLISSSLFVTAVFAGDYIYVSSAVTVSGTQISLSEYPGGDTEGYLTKEISVQAENGDVQFSINKGSHIYLTNGQSFTQEFDNDNWRIYNATVTIESLESNTTAHVFISGGD